MNKTSGFPRPSATRNKAYALVDVNSFYASCERVFQPHLANRPVVVLSNNDGCVVARSPEVKALDIPNGSPWFKAQPLAKKHGIVAFSSNYTLYADLSNRVMSILGTFSPEQEVYSIDECFLDLTTFSHPGHLGLTDYSREMRGAVKKLTGLPVCVGVGASKTLSKLANHVAKKRPRYGGVFNFNELDEAAVDALLGEIHVSEVWGVGRRTTTKLERLGIRTVLDLKRANPKRIRSLFTVVMERTVAELNGVSCLSLEEVNPPNKQIICSRSFGKRTGDLEELEQSVVQYMTRAAEKLRRQRSLAGLAHVYLRTNRFKEDEPQHSQGVTLPLGEPTDDTFALVRAALAGLRRIHRPGYLYQKTGVMLSELIPAAKRQPTLFDDAEVLGRSRALMEAMDQLNRSLGSGAVRLGGEGLEKPWEMRRNHLSRRFTTRLDEIAVARAR